MLTVIPTIDVEGVHGTRPFQQMVLGQVGHGEEWGVFRLARIFGEFGIQATFFVDVYEHTLWGEAPIQEVCLGLAELDQDVQLHTHPAWRDDIHDFQWLRILKRERSFLSQDLDLMAKLTLEKQVEVLEHGIEVFQKWLGRRPIAHRSGGYSINDDTVAALARVGIRLDSSMHAGHANSRVTWSANRIMEKDGVIELPVTVLKYVFRVPLGNSGRDIYAKLMKTDLDTCSVDEFVAYVDQAELKSVKILNLFMHSYSLVEFDALYRRLIPKRDGMEKLCDLLHRLRRDPRVRFLSCAQLVRSYESDPEQFDGSDEIPEVQVNRKIVSLAARKAKHVIQDAVLKLRQRCPEKR